jgi:hypothetical protein
VVDEARKEAERLKLLAAGWASEDLTWTTPGSAVAVELIYLRGQDKSKELRKAIDRMQAGQWLIKASAVERRIRAMRGCENFSIAKWSLPSFLAKVFGSRAARS